MGKLQFYPVTSRRWKDLEALFGARGACGGCWCMVWRRKPSDWQREKGSGNKRALKSLVSKGIVPGIIAYSGRTPIGWCSIAPREDFQFLDRSRVLARIDTAQVWSVSCLFVARENRGKGISVELLRAAAAYVKKQGGAIVEGYPTVPYAEKIPDAFAWTGTATAFERAGFTVAARRSRSRPIMRCVLSH